MRAPAVKIGSAGSDADRHGVGVPRSRTIVYRPLCAATVVRPTRLCLRGTRPKPSAGWEAYLDWCARWCDCVRCNREQV